MDTCLRYISGDMPLSKEGNFSSKFIHNHHSKLPLEVIHQVNSFFQAAKQIQSMFDHVLAMDVNNDKLAHKFQVQEVC